MTLDRCTGHCCRSFPLLQYEKLMADPARHQDGEQIAAMVVLIPESDPPRFTCRNLQPNGDCGVYEARPAMCRDFPYDRRCGVPGCTWASRCGRPDDPPEALQGM